MEQWVTNFQGELAALGGAFLWALSSAAYSLLGQKISALKLNLFKGLIAIALIFLTLIISGKLETEVNLFTHLNVCSQDSVFTPSKDLASLGLHILWHHGSTWFLK